MNKIMSLLLASVFMFASVSFAEEPDESAESMESLMSVVSIDDASLRQEAEKLGIPEAETKRYVVDMKSINKEYQAGSLTRTEYIAFKRQLIERLK
ncbi:hypothetical protein ACFL5C_00925 [Candidatus Omnitrophota bacterium]